MDKGTADNSLWLEKTWEKLAVKLRAECERTGTNIPFIPLEGRYVDCMMPGGVSWWTNGFWPGILWQMYHATGDQCYRSAAEGVEDRLDECFTSFHNLDHDIGFLFLPSAAADYELTGSETSFHRAMHAATILAGRFNAAGGFLRAWEQTHWKEDVSGWMIIDCMMNIPLLFWAGEHSGDARFSHIAIRHADTTERYLLRPDGSCSHIAVFDPLTGSFLSNLAGQGYAVESSWSRGQGWALYGFALAFKHTKEARFLDSAKRCAHYSIAALAASEWLPVIDFRAPEEPVRYDSGAGAILACGLLELSGLVPDPEKSLYTSAAWKILRTCEEQFANWDPDSDGILEGGSTCYHNDRLAGHAYIYNDYFLTEGILRLKGNYFPIW